MRDILSSKIDIKMPLISIIIPTHNRVHIVCNAIESALNQTYKYIEILLVDDGSTDGTKELVSQFEGKIQYVFKPNGGVSSARNLGIIKSAGELIAFLDSDDEWLPEKIEIQVEYLKQHPDVGMVLCDCYFVDSNREILGESDRRTKLPNDGNILEDVFISPSLIPSSVLVRKYVLDDVGCFDETLKTAEDLDLHLKIAEKYKIGLIDDPLLFYMRGDKGLSMLSCTYDDHVYVIERFVRLHQNRLDLRIIKRGFFKVYLAAANGKYWHKELKTGTRFVFKASKLIGSSDDLIGIGKALINGLNCLLKSVICMTSKRKTGSE